MPKIYNSLENPDLQFALLHRVPREYCERVVKGKKFKEDSVSLIAGDGRYGFQSRRQKREVASMVATVDGTGFKKSKKTACRPRKEVCKLVSSAELCRLTMDPDLRDQRDKEAKKTKRAKHRNKGARLGRKQTLVFQSNPTRGRRGGLTPSTVNH